MLRLPVHRRRRVLVDLRGDLAIAVGHHRALDLLLGHGTEDLDLGRLRLAGGLIARAHAEDAVGVDFERDPDRDLAARARLQARQAQLTERRIVLEPARLALAHLDLDGGLVLVRSREQAGLLGRDLRVALNDGLGVAAQRADAERARRHVPPQRLYPALSPAPS